MVGLAEQIALAEIDIEIEQVAQGLLVLDSLDNHIDSGEVELALQAGERS